MSLYTRKGDDGTTKVFDSEKGVRISKNSALAETLGALDEVNSFLGLAKVRAQESRLRPASIKDFGRTQQGYGGQVRIETILHTAQKNLFIVQAEVAGAQKTIGEEKIKEIEAAIDAIEKELPPITTFFISGGTELAALLDIARTLARHAERQVVGIAKSEERPIGEYTLQYVNRLSSLLYALARFANHEAGVVEEGPDYQ